MSTDEERSEAERLRVILETLAHAHPELALSEAVPTIFAIEKRTAALEAPELARPRGYLLHDSDPETVADFIDTQAHIQDLITGGKKIFAIKEVRSLVLDSRTSSGRLGLKEAKEGVDCWAMRHARPSSSGIGPGASLAIATWISEPTQKHIRTFIEDGRPIDAIKAVRLEFPPGASLIEAKKGVEFYRKAYGM